MARGPAKRFVDIEYALRWAYRDELPKRRSGGEVIGPSSPMFGGSIVDDERRADLPKWRMEPGFPAAVGAPHADALAIEAAVKGLEAWRGHGFGPDDRAGLMHGMDLAAWSSHLDHVQAGMEAVAMMAGLVAVHARAGTRPRWSRELPEPFPDIGENGKPPVLVDEVFVEKVDRHGVYYAPDRNPPPRAITFVQAVPSPHIRKALYRTGAYCPLIYRPSPAGIVRERAEYAAWRMGLELLQASLEGALSSLAPLPPAAPWRPWAGEREAHGRVPELFRGQRDEPYRRLTREQEAARRGAAQRRRLQVRTEETRPVRAPPGRRRDDSTNGM